MPGPKLSGEYKLAGDISGQSSRNQNKGEKGAPPTYLENYSFSGYDTSRSDHSPPGWECLGTQDLNCFFFLQRDITKICQLPAKPLIWDYSTARYKGEKRIHSSLCMRPRWEGMRRNAVRVESTLDIHISFQGAAGNSRSHGCPPKPGC